MNQSFEKLQNQLEKAMALQTAMVLFEWDNETLAPREAGELTSKVIGVLSGGRENGGGHRFSFQPVS